MSDWDYDPEAGVKDEETGERIMSLKTSIIAVCGLIYLVVVAQLVFQATFLSIDRWIVKDPEYQDSKTREKIISYIIISIIMVAAFVLFTKYVAHEPLHLFY